jgi:hypothetical protein
VGISSCGSTRTGLTVAVLIDNNGSQPKIDIYILVLATELRAASVPVAASVVVSTCIRRHYHREAANNCSGCE